MEKEGKVVSTALQMALLNCCITVGQQICTLSLAGIEGVYSLEEALPCVFMLAGGALTLATFITLFINDKNVDEDSTTGSSESTSEEDNLEESGQSSSE